MSEAQVLIPSKDLQADVDFITELGFRLDKIYPDDSPQVALMSGHGLKLRLDINVEASSPTIHILSDNPDSIGNGSSPFESPGGAKFEVHNKSYTLETPPTEHNFEVRRLLDNEPWVIGRAGMLYRDLIPNRLGGGIIASHIRIPDGGPVPDMVHYHTIGFQLIYCYKGWVKLVYEDQGPPFILEAGDCVTQPPEIRHRVLESSDNLEVIEIGVPASHMTTIDHELELPNKEYNPSRDFQGQRFCHHKASEASWQSWRVSSFEFRDTGIEEATGGFASVHIARASDIKGDSSEISHDADILFTFVLDGELKLSANGHEAASLKAGEAFVIPPDMKYKLSNLSPNLELLEISLPGKFSTIVHS